MKNGGRGNDNRRKSGGRGQKKRPQEKKKPVTAEELDSAMDDYWLKSENKEVAAKKLDEDMDAYWEKKGQTTAEDAVEETAQE